VYPSNIGRPPYATHYFSARFYCALITLHVSAPFGGHLQVVRKHKNIFKVVTIYSTDPFICLYMSTQRIRLFAYTCLLNGSVEYIVTTLNIFLCL
jgi:hypothetical protein